MEPPGKRMRYGLILMIILGLVVLALPVAACETPTPTPTPSPEYHHKCHPYSPNCPTPTLTPTPICTPTPTPTPTPTCTPTPTPIPTPTITPTPTPTPAPQTCTTPYSLVTADGETIGCIAVWDIFDENGVHSLHVLYSMFESSDLYLARADLAIGLLVTDIPQENGVPVPGNFPYIMPFDQPVQSYEFSIILPSQFDDVAYLYIATHALTASGKDAWVLEDNGQGGVAEYFIYILGTGVPPTPSPEPPLPSTTPGQGPTYVQSTSMSFGYGNQAEASIPLPGPSNSGDLVIISFIYMDHSRTVESVTDSKGNVYNLAVGPTHVGGNGWGNAYTYYAKDIAGEGAPITITVTLSGLADDVFDLFVSEYSGMDISEPLDQTSSGSGSGTAMESGVKTTTSTPELIYTFGAGDDYCHPTEPFTELETTNGQFTADWIVSSIDSYGATGTQDIDGYWMLQMATFKGA